MRPDGGAELPIVGSVTYTIPDELASHEQQLLDRDPHITAIICTELDGGSKEGLNPLIHSHIIALSRSQL